MIVTLALLLGLVAFSIFIGSLGCTLFLCYQISYPFLIITSIVVGLISINLLSKKYKIKRLLLLLIIPLYVIVPTVIAFNSMTYFHNKGNQKYLAQWSKEDREQHFDRVRPNSIKRVGNNIVYECKVCGYRVTFPADWGFEDLHLGYQYNDYWQDFKLVTSNFSRASPYKGQEFHIQSFLLNSTRRAFEAAQKSYSNTHLSEIVINGSKAQVLKYYTREDDAPKNIIIKFSSQSHTFEISIAYQDENELNANLKIILDHFEFID